MVFSHSFSLSKNSFCFFSSSFIKDLDFNKDGKISVEELNQYADQLEDIEGVGVVKEEKENQK